MNSLLPQLKDVRTAAKDSQVHRWNRIRPSIGRVGKVFPKKEQAKGELNEKLDLFCVSLEKEKDSNLNLPTLEQDASHKGGPDADNVTEICLPELPSALGDRRHGSSSTTPEPPPDFLIQGQSRTLRSPQALCVIPELPESEAVQTMRAELEPLLEELKEEDIFGTEDEPRSLNRILFVRKMGIYVEVRSRDYVPGVCCVPLFHCPRCLDHWTNLGRVPEKCRFKKQLTCGPEIVVNYWNQNQTNGEGNTGGILDVSATSSARYYSNNKHGAGRPGDNNRLPSSPTGSPDDMTSLDRLLMGEGQFEDLENLSDERLMEVLQRNLSHGRLLNGDEYSRQLAEVLGVGDDQYADFARISKDLSPGKDARHRSSGDQENRSDLYETLNELKVHELPSEMKAKLLRLLQAQRARKLETMNETSDGVRDDLLHEQGANKGQRKKIEKIDAAGSWARQPDAASRSRGERSSRDHEESRDAGKGIDAPGRVEAWNGTEAMPGHFVDNSSTDPLLLTVEDENNWDNRHSPDILQYQELQKQRRAKKKNPAVWNKTGQPDTPRPRLGKYAMSVPSNSSSVAYYSEDVDEEDWDLGRSAQIGHSRARLSDSRNSMWRKYSRAGSSSHSTATREFSLTGFDDQSSRTSSQLSASDVSRRDWKGGRGAKKEKTDAVRRPRAYHSKLVNNLQLDPGEARPLISTNNNNNNSNTGQRHSTTRGSDYTEVTLREKRELPPTVSYVHHDSACLDEFSDNEAASWTRPISSGQRSPDVSLPDIRRSCTPKLCAPQATQPTSSTQSQGRAELSGDLSPDHALLDKILAESPERSTTGQGILTPSPSPARTPKEKSSLVSLYDLRGLQRLPLTSAFSFSYYALPHQHKQMNKSIDQASKRIGRKRKGTVRSRSVP